MKIKNKNILVWGGSSRAHKLLTMMKNINVLDKKYLNCKSINLKKFFVFDTYVKKLNFECIIFPAMNNLSYLHPKILNFYENNHQENLNKQLFDAFK